MGGVRTSLSLSVGVCCVLAPAAVAQEEETHGTRRPIANALRSFKLKYKDFVSNYVKKDSNGNVHVNAPGVNVDVSGEPGHRKMNLDAPFVHMKQAPIGRNNKDAITTVKAPFTRVQTSTNGPTIVSAPLAHVNREANGSLTVRAPLTHVNKAANGALVVRAPLTHVDSQANGATSVSAPLTHVDKAANGETSVRAPFTSVNEANDEPVRMTIHTPPAKQ